MLKGRLSRLIFTVLLCLQFTFSAKVLADQAHQLDIPQGSLAEALNTFALQTGILLQFDPKQVGDLQSTGLKGEFELDTGFQQLLLGTGLYAEKTANGSYVIRVLLTMSLINL